MNPIWIVVVALVGLFVITRIRSRKRTRRDKRPPVAGPRVQGSQVVACLHPRMGAACLADAGMQFGKGFRRKEGPQLPHDAQCRCEVVNFAFTSSEVFNGALRQLGAVKSVLPELSPEDGQRLVERLRAVEAAPVPAERAAYEAAVGVEAFAPGVQEALRSFLAERHAFLQQTVAEAPAGSGTDTRERMESSE
jgi:hypothetical protein